MRMNGIDIQQGADEVLEPLFIEKDLQIDNTTFHCQQLKAKVLENVTSFSQKGYYSCVIY